MTEGENAEFITGLGLPFETSIALLGPGTFLRKNVLGGMLPPLRLGAEAVVGKSFYFGSDFGTFRHAPAWLPAAFTDEITLPDGTKRYEISGQANELLNALPTSRLEGLVSKWLDSNRSKVSTLLQTLTGVRTISVDMRQEMERRLVDYLKSKAKSGQVGETLVFFNRMDPESIPEDLKLVLGTLTDMKKERRKRRALVSAD
jgi:hypothetical protein